MNNTSKFNIGLKAALTAGVGMSALLTGGVLSATAQDEAVEEDKRLNTITITATKREQTLQDVPVAVSVVDESVIEKAEIQDLGDLQSLVPSLVVGQLQSSASTNFIIRGFGNGANNAGIEPSVGVFIDGVYRSRSAAQIADLPNLQRVEVLRGPQSTLFGKNASAGVISIVTRKPQFETGGSIEGSYGNYNAFRLKGDITGPLSENVAYSLSANMNKRDGYADDLATGNDVNQRDRWGLRGQLLFTPTENLELRVIADYDSIDEICCVAGNLVNGPTGPIIGALGGALDAENPFSYEVYNNFDSINEIENSGISLQADYEMEFATLTSITAFRNNETVTNQDSDFTSADLVGRNYNDGTIDTFTQEVRLTSNNTDGMVDWMIGGFYFDESVDFTNDFFYGDDYRGYADFLAGGPSALAGTEAFLGLPAGTFGASGTGHVSAFGQENTAWSVFGALDFHLSDRLTATVGGNYTSDEKDAYGNIVSTDALSGLNLTELGYTATLAGALGASGVDVTDPVSIGTFIATQPAAFAGLQAFSAAAAQDPAQNPFAAFSAFQFLPPFLNFPNAVEDGSTSDDKFTYTLRLAYDLSDNINVYGSYATGFKASSWNLSRDSRPFASDFVPGASITDPFTGQTILATPSSPITDAGLAVNNLTTGTRFAGPEEAKVFEVGVKGAFNNFAFNLAIFDQTIEGFQSNAFTGTGFALANAGEQSTTGLEIDMTWNPTDALTLTFAGTFLDPVYDSFPGSASGDISGQTPSGIAETNTSLGVNYDFTFNGWDSFLRADWQYASDNEFFDDPGNIALLDTVGYSREVNTVNASLGFVTDGGLGVTFWSRNLFDDERITTAFPSVAQAGSISGYPSQPATYGVTVRKTF